MITGFDKLKALHRFKEMEKLRAEEPQEIHWKPISIISVDEIYKSLPRAKQFHEEYVKLWLSNGGKNGR